MIKHLKLTITFQILILTCLIFLRFFITTLISINYQTFAFYRQHNLNLTTNSQQLQTQLNTSQTLSSLTQWATSQGFTEITTFSQLPTLTSLAQNPTY